MESSINHKEEIKIQRFADDNALKKITVNALFQQGVKGPWNLD